MSCRLVPFLKKKYGTNFNDNICFVKIDTDGHDIVILEDFNQSKFKPPIIWTEWFLDYRFIREKGQKIEEVWQ